MGCEAKAAMPVMIRWTQGEPGMRSTKGHELTRNVVSRSLV